MTRSPGDDWVAQQLRLAATPFGEGPHFLIRDNDNKYGDAFDGVADGSGIEVLPTIAENGVATGRLWTFCADRGHEPLPRFASPLWGCGWFGDPVQECSCSMSMVSRYQKRIPSALLRTGSGPLLDRIDTLRDIEVPRVEYKKLSDERLGEPSAAIRQRVEAPRFSGTRMLAKADAPGIQGFVRGRRGTTAGWTTSMPTS